jgi:hypothetical protein
LRQAEPASSQFDLYRHRKRYEAAAEVVQARYWPLDLGKQRELSRQTGRLSRLQATQAVRLAFGGSLGVSMPPRLDVFRLNGIAFKLARQTHSITAAGQFV